MPTQPHPIDHVGLAGARHGIGTPVDTSPVAQQGGPPTAVTSGTPSQGRLLP